MLAALLVISFPVTLGLSIIIWYWLFAVAACFLTVVGVFKVAGGLGAPLWVGIALAAPGVVWATDQLYEMISQTPQPTIWITFGAAAVVARLAAGAGALRLVEMMSRPRALFHAGYWVLVAGVLPMGIGLLARTAAWSFTNNALYVMAVQLLSILAAIVKYGAFIWAAVLISHHRHIERWVGVVISLISTYLLYEALSSTFVGTILGHGDGLISWLQPLVMFLGGAAVWRMGSVLCAQPLSEMSLQN